MKLISYKEAGVDIDAGNEFVNLIKPFVKSTTNDGVLGTIGSFSGAYKLPSGYKNPVLLAGTDGVGTKLRVAIDAGHYDSIGIDLVAMCVNDLICNFAKPLFFLDYYATAKLELEVATKVVKGIADGCRQAGCALIGGETAEMPSMYEKGDFDLAGFAVGIAEEDEIDRTKFVKEGDVLIALPSSGLHSNGYSLARAVIKDLGLQNDENVIKILLEPTRIYVKEFLALKDKINALAHITGGGIIENLPRVLPDGLGAVVQRSTIKQSEIFEILAKKVERAEMDRTFNCGVGMVVVASKQNADYIIQNSDGYAIGEIIKGSSVIYK
ncbi:MAG: phosphoribosylformylglycinamidine cyclo-ligase [Campylobacter sp.]|nr:phosphoribosylformylglycinamidine cyclo-ligase [Campylobacter sp.]